MTAAQQVGACNTKQHAALQAYAEVLVQEYFSLSIHQPYAPQAIAASSAYHMNGRGAPITTYEEMDDEETSLRRTLFEIKIRQG